MEREATLRQDKAALAAEAAELRLKVKDLSRELSESARLSQDRLVDSQVGPHGDSDYRFLVLVVLVVLVVVVVLELFGSIDVAL